MILIDNLTVELQGHVVLEQLAGQFAPGQVHGIMGLNGAGKTTLLNALYGFLKPITDQVIYQGSRLSKKHLAYLEASNYFYSNITGSEYLRLFCHGQTRYDQWNDLFQLPLSNLIESYSTGMKKKLALLGVLLQNKPILLLDEPFSGLDLESMWMVKRILAEIKPAKTILLTSHIFETLIANCDFIYRLENKTISHTYAQADFEAFQERLYQELHDRTALR